MARRIRVMMLVGRVTDRTGGGERAAIGLALHLPRDRYDVCVCFTRTSGGSPVRALREAGIDVVDLGRTRRLDPAAVRRCIAEVRRRRIDVLHAHMFGSNVWAAAIGRACRVPVVIAHEQTWSYEGEPLRKAADAVIGRLVDAFLAVSSADAERMHRLERIPRAKIHLVPNAWIPREEPATADVRAEVGVGEGTPVVGTVAVPRTQKRLDVLLDAFARVHAAEPATRLLLAGGGTPADESRLEGLIASLDCAEAVHRLGTRQDIDAVLRAFDVFAMSSDFEGTPLAALEAMNAGVPVVATDVGGLRDIVEPERSGLLVPRRDPEALAGALLRLLRDRELRDRFGAAARERAGEFTAERHAERCAEIYERLLAAKGAVT